jgi:perosamine synthetase
MLPVSRPYLGKEELDEIEKVFDSRWLGLGATVREFECKASEFLGAPNFIAVNTGTTALQLALRVCGIGPGDEVIVPALTFAASPQAILSTGATPVFCDINDETMNMDVEDVEALISPKTKAIMPVHYRGLSCDMEKLLDIANKKNIQVIEDAAHAFGSKCNGKYIGSFGHVTCFSFDPIKNITCGEGGGIVFQDQNKYDTAIKMRILGIDKETWTRYQNKREWFYDITSEGYRYHMPNIFAAIGIVQLTKFTEMNNRRIEICKKYDSELADLKQIKILPMNYNETAPFMYIVLCKNRELFMAEMGKSGIGTGVHYIPCHTFTYFSKYRRSSLQVTEKISDSLTTLPLYYELKETELDHIINTVKQFDLINN